jgi:DNA-binding NtrC family response regulator
MLANCKILVVDDQKTVCEGVGKILTKRGCSVERTYDGRSALELLDRNKFDLVIADLMMPRVSGMELLRYVKERHPDVQVVMITGYASIDSAVEATKNGAAGFVPKPFTPEELAVVVENALARRAQAPKPQRAADAPPAPAEPEKLIDVDEPFSGAELAAATSEAFVETISRTDIQASKPDFCPKGAMACKKYVKTGVCKGDCPIRARDAKAKPARHLGLAARTGGVIDVDMPFNFGEVAAAASPAYAATVSRSDLPVQSADWQVMAHGKSILVIDDEPVVCNSLRRILDRQGHHVDQALSPDEGLARLEANRYDLVLLDLRMPGKSGLEVLSAIKGCWPDTKVIIVTGYATIESAVEATRLGAAQYIAKPFTPEELMRATNAVFEEAA